jgi:cyclopropane fatty-acyl-phospholipid synthase-like methyltransferase
LKKKLEIFETFHSQLDLPFLETDVSFIEEIFKTLELEFGLEHNSKQKLIDLGAGNGSIIIYSALNYNIDSHGIEIDQNLKNEADNRIKLMKKEGKYEKRRFNKIEIVIGDFYVVNLEKYDFIYIYSLPSMQKFLKPLFKTANKGAIIISHRYPIEDYTSLLRLEYTLKHERAEKEIYSFFYVKIS